ncbi:threonine--tRNA ligase [Actinoplanes sp. TBRC 11911]|uniref:threonine--tRNA ligase n=1 Tax=Actinoplanes sp. TBRC 11911 TaxID=2729386 RepID=UPI00145F2CF8|nr:threonine--tRNA ligase [Actinoplanes sp. TBRC 11911]NMO52645.1 threonine--tRNA ligase [Actinoplanes sp. TBRC 11911]
MDHRKLGRDLDIFDSDPLIGAGLPFWLPGGAAARYEVERYLRGLERRAGYQHVYSPALGKRRMYELSGHWKNYADDMFPPMRMGDDELVLRPSNCPHHALIFKSRQRSYRDLPLRIAEMGDMYRAERSGVVGGLGRVRAIHLNDAHNFCALDQVADEVAAILRLMREAHAALGFEPASYRLSLRGNGGKYGGDDEEWALAGKLLREALDAERISYVEAAGEAAFYGPKIDVQIADAAGRESSLATVQVDFHQPRQFGLEYADAAGGRSRPVMVHRSLAGSMERLFAHLLEVHQGAFPVWYAPVQLDVLPVSADQAAQAHALVGAAMDDDLRAEAHHDGSIGARIRHAAERKIPYVGVIGAREAEAGQVALRLRDGRQLRPMPIADAIALIGRIARDRSSGLD